MKLPGGYLLAWSVVFIGGGAYILWGAPNARPSFQIISAALGCVSILLGVLLWAKFRWVPELFLAVMLFFLGWGIIASVTDEKNRIRIYMIGGSITALFGYPTIRREVRGKKDGSATTSTFEDENNEDDHSNIDKQALPRWVGVALALRCAKITLPLYDRVPFSIKAERREALINAINLIEQSVGQGYAEKGLKETWNQIVMARGAVARKADELNEKGELTPEIETAAGVATNVTYIVEHALGAATSDFPESWHKTLRAFGLANDTCDLANEPAMKKRIENDATFLRGVAQDPACTDRTPVLMDVFD